VQCDEESGSASDGDFEAVGMDGDRVDQFLDDNAAFLVVGVVPYFCRVPIGRSARVRY
jgi:hypothetical protein